LYATTLIKTWNGLASLKIVSVLSKATGTRGMFVVTSFPSTDIQRGVDICMTLITSKQRPKKQLNILCEGVFMVYDISYTLRALRLGVEVEEEYIVGAKWDFFF
jgi:hypothetical protein